jgi:ribonucleoside-triphosphate reductase
MAQNGLLGEVAFVAQYARETEDGGRETWDQAVDRVEAMHIKRFPYMAGQIKDAFGFVRRKEVFPSQRSMQFGGRPIERNNMRIYNCTFSPCDRLRFFGEAFWLLLSGCGTGFSVRHTHIKQLPRLLTPRELAAREPRVVRVEDSIEGWARAAQMLIENYHHRGYYERYYNISFDFSLIREKGAPISSGGRAPGAAPLTVALERIDALLRSRIVTVGLDRIASILRERPVTAGLSRLRSIDCFDIVMFLSEAVLSGGVRRSASIAIFDEDDELMLKAKTGDWWRDNPQRAYANISAGVVLNGDESRATVEQIVDMAKQWGEPGVAFFPSEDMGTNPCAEIGLYPYLVERPDARMGRIRVEYPNLSITRGRERLTQERWSFASGWAVCNLSEINGARITSADHFVEAAKAAAFIGTLQASYTDVGYLTETTKQIIEQEALLGVSITGMCETPKLLFDPAVLEAGARAAIIENQRVAELIGIKRASRVTTVKPSGNTSTIAGGVSAGVHTAHARRFIRRMRLAKVNPVWQQLRDKVPGACVDLDEHTGVVAFACAASEGALTRETDSARAHLDRVSLVYKHWVAPGSVESRVEGLTHNVSNTCTVRAEEWEEVADYLWTNRHHLRGVALLGYFGDHLYDQAPYQTVVEGEASEKEWERLAALDWGDAAVSLHAVEGPADLPALDPACAGGTCLL